MNEGGVTGKYLKRKFPDNAAMREVIDYIDAMRARSSAEVIIQIIYEQFINNTTNIYQTINNIIGTNQGTDHKAYLIENTSNIAETIISEWSVLPYSQQCGIFEATVTVHDKTTNAITSARSLLSFDYSEAPEVTAQNDLLTNAGISLTVGVNLSGNLYVTASAMSANQKRIHVCLKRCVLSQRVKEMSASGTFVLTGNSALATTIVRNLSASAGAFALTGSARLQQNRNMSGTGSFALNGSAAFETPTPSGLKLTWDNIANVPVANVASVSDWNDFFDLPVNGTPFTSVTVDGNIVYLKGGANITVKSNLFDAAILHILSFEDNDAVIVAAADNAFYNCVLMSTLILPEITTAGNGAFRYVGGGAESGSAIIETPGLITAGEWCFSASLIGTINLPNLTEAGYCCFAGCNAATSAYLPVVETIGVGCFNDCNLIESFNFPELTLLNSQSIEGGTPDEGGQFVGCTAALSFSIPLVSHIPALCFNGCTSATTFNLDAVESIGFAAFSNCESCVEFNFPALKSVDGSFQNCTAATTFNFPALETITGDAFYNCTSVVEFNFPALISLSGQCFTDCSAATIFDFPALLYIYYSGCFSGCISATTFNMPTLLQLGDTAYNNSIFSGISGNTILLTVPAALMTLIFGTSPDFDIQYLQANNTVTVITT